jgi:hypothetical protein
MPAANKKDLLYLLHFIEILAPGQIRLGAASKSRGLTARMVRLRLYFSNDTRIPVSLSKKLLTAPGRGLCGLLNGV